MPVQLSELVSVPTGSDNRRSNVIWNPVSLFQTSSLDASSENRTFFVSFVSGRIFFHKYGVRKLFTAQITRLRYLFLIVC